MRFVAFLVCLAVVFQSGNLLADEAAKSAAYEAAPAAAEAVPAVDLTGTWTGTWCSGKNGHHGPMTAQFSAGCNGSYEV
ncbi:MAG: hypothetical protein ACKPJD_11435, partial [Planctomycetaceae bacterium]